MGSFISFDNRIKRIINRIKVLCNFRIHLLVFFSGNDIRDDFQYNVS